MRTNHLPYPLTPLPHPPSTYAKRHTPNPPQVAHSPTPQPNKPADPLTKPCSNPRLTLAEFNQIQSAKRSTYRQKAAAAKRGAGTPLADADTSALAEGTPSKKPRVEGDEAEEEEEDVPDHEVEDDVVDEDEEEEEEEEEEEDEEEEEEEGGGVEGKDDRDETLDVEERRRVGDESGDESD